MRIHLFGASGSGCTSLGRGLAAHLDCAFFDTDDFYWKPTDPPFVERTEVSIRNARLGAAMRQHANWVLAGSISEAWGSEIVEGITLSIFIVLPHSKRMARLVARELDRYGSRICAGGDMQANSERFIEWAKGYDASLLPGRSRARHEAWFASMRCEKWVVDNQDVHTRVLQELIGRIEASKPTESRG